MEPVPGSPVPTPPTYDAFISYRHADEDRREATWLHRALETWRTPRVLVAAGIAARLRTVFRDEDEMHAGAHLASQIDTALAASRWLLVVCSPRTPGSEWVAHEIRRFRELGRGEQILPLLIEGDPSTSFPPGLRDEPAGSDADPLAADLRPSTGHGASAVRRLALLRLLAPMLGVRFDDLRRREDERRARRRRTLSVVAAAGFLIVGGAGYLALRAEGRASDSRRAEQSARQETDELVRYLVSEVSPGLLGGARLDVLKGYLARIDRHYGDRPAAQLTANDRVHRAATLLATALVRGGTSDLPGALDGLREAEGELRALPSDGPLGVQVGTLRVDVLRHTAGVLTTLGRPESSLEKARAAVDAARALVSQHPDDPGVRRLLGLSLSTVGAIAPRVHAVDEGRKALDEAVLILTLLLGSGDDVRPRGDLAFARRNLSRVLSAQGDPEGALREVRAAAALTRVDDEDDADGAGERAETLEVLGATLVDSGSLQEACASQRAALAIRERAVRKDPGNEGFVLALCASRRQLAPILMRLGQVEEAGQALDQAMAGLDDLRGRNPESVGVVGEWAVTAGMRARRLLARGEGARALEESTRAIDALGALRTAGKADRLRRTYEVQLLIEEADVFESMADRDRQRRDLERALTLARDLLGEDPADAKLAVAVVHARMELSLVLDAVGQSERSLVEARDAVASAQALLTCAPADPGRLSLHGFATDRLGRVLGRAGRHAEALEAFRSSVASMAARLAADGGAASTASELAIAQMKVGDMLLELGRIDDALAAFRAARDALPSLGDVPRDATLARRTSSMVERIARCLWAKAQFASAAATFEDAANHQEMAVRGSAGDLRKVEQLRALAARMRGTAHAADLLATGVDATTSEERLEVAGLLSGRGRVGESLAAFRTGLAGTVDAGLRRRWTAPGATTCALVARTGTPEEARALHAQAVAWLREHVVLTWAEIRRLEGESASLPRDRRAVPDAELANLKRALAELEREDPAFAEMRGTPEFAAIFSPP